MELSTTAKVGIGGSLGTVTVGGPVAAYLAKDHINYYEVERKVMNEDVTFEVVSKTGETGVFNIEVKTGTGWGANTETGKYYWKCEIKGLTGSSLEEDIKIILNKPIGGNYEIKRNLVQSCSKDRNADSNVKSSNKKVSSKLDLTNVGNSSDSWDKKLFGKEFLGQVEKAVFEETNKVYFEITDKSGNTPLTIKAKSTDSNSNFKDDATNKYSWECVLSGVPEDINKSKLEEKLPKDASSIDSNKKARKKLVYACAKGRTSDFSSTSVKTNINFPAESTASNWYTKLLGE